MIVCVGAGQPGEVSDVLPVPATFALAAVEAAGHGACV